MPSLIKRSSAHSSKPGASLPARTIRQQQPRWRSTVASKTIGGPGSRTIVIRMGKMKPLRNYLLASLFAALLACPAAQAATRPVISQSEVAFAPDPAALQLVLKAIQSARRSIHVAAYVFTSKPVAQALLTAQRAGIEVAVVADRKENSGRYSATRFLADQQVAVRLNSRYAIFHHKFMIIDAMHVQTGSFNYTYIV